jgi:hypothetical protein
MTFGERRWTGPFHRVSVRFELGGQLRSVRQRLLSYTFPSLLAGPGLSDTPGRSRSLSGLLPPWRLLSASPGSCDCPAAEFTRKDRDLRRVPIPRKHLRAELGA